MERSAEESGLRIDAEIRLDGSALISDDYRRQQKIMHVNPDYGTASLAYAPMVSGICDRLRVTELLDYGCGKGRLAQNLKVGHQMRVQLYDPALPEYAGDPVPMQMVACIDVLEHIEPDRLEAVLDDLKRVTQAVGFFSVSTCLAKKTLPDGRNAHLIIEPAEWWLPKFWSRFDVHTFQMIEDGFFVIAYAKVLQ